MKINKTWTLPPPEEKEDSLEWYPVVRIGRIVPFGYKQDEADRDLLIPIRDELELFEKARNYLRQYSYRDVANWLSEQSGRYISHVGLMKRVKLGQKRKREAENQRYLAQRYKEAMEKAEKLEKGRFDPVRRTTEGLSSSTT